MSHNDLTFAQEEIYKLGRVKTSPAEGLKSFGSRVGYALFLMCKEKEVIVFALLQWVVIGLTYLLWVQVLDWIPDEVWESAKDPEKASLNEVSLADFALFAWSLLCVGLAAFPVGILTGCMGAAHFLHREGRESTIATCFKLVLPNAWSLWIFHWIDGWITVERILERIPGGDDRITAAEKALHEAMYYAWKIAVAGVLPSILTGNNIIQSGKNSIVFVKENFVEVAQLRAGYSLICWVLGIGAYIGSIIFFSETGILSREGNAPNQMYAFYLWAGVPIVVALAFVMLLLRPIYVLALCDLYSDHIDERGEKIEIPTTSTTTSAFVAFGVLCVLIGTAYLYREELGFMDLLATHYGQEHHPSTE